MVNAAGSEPVSKRNVGFETHHEQTTITVVGPVSVQAKRKGHQPCEPGSIPGYYPATKPIAELSACAWHVGDFARMSDT